MTMMQAVSRFGEERRRGVAMPKLYSYIGAYQYDNETSELTRNAIE